MFHRFPGTQDQMRVWLLWYRETGQCFQIQLYYTKRFEDCVFVHTDKVKYILVPSLTRKGDMLHEFRIAVEKRNTS